MTLKTKIYGPLADFDGTNFSKLVHGFTFKIINEQFAVWFLIKNKVLGVFRPWPKRLTFIS